MNDITALLGDIKLRFNIEHPSVEECYLFGYEYAVNDLEESENPYNPGTMEHDQWMEGWWAGFYGEKPIFDAIPETAEQSAIPLAANDETYREDKSSVWQRWLKITGALAASAVVGYQVIDLVA